MTNYIFCSKCHKHNCTSQIANYCTWCGNSFSKLTEKDNLIGIIENVKLTFFNSKIEVYNYEFTINQSITLKLFSNNILVLSQKGTNAVIQNNIFSMEVQKENSDVIITLKSDDCTFSFSYKINQNNFLKVSSYEYIINKFIKG